MNAFALLKANSCVQICSLVLVMGVTSQNNIMFIQKIIKNNNFNTSYDNFSDSSQFTLIISSFQTSDRYSYIQLLAQVNNNYYN